MLGEQNTSHEIDYSAQEPGSVPGSQFTYELFISHCTSSKSIGGESNSQFYFVSQMYERLKIFHKLPTFFYDGETRANPFYTMNYSIPHSRIVIAVCTPQYIQKVNLRGTYPHKEIAAFDIYSTRENKDNVIPVLLDTTRTVFQTREGGIPLISSATSVEIPLEYKNPEKISEILQTKCEEVVKIYRELRKQWD